NIEGTGWLAMEELLRMPMRQRTVFSAMVRFMTDEATDQDDIVLLDYLAVSAARHLVAFRSRPQKTEENASVEAPNDNIVVAVENFAPNDSVPNIASVQLLRDHDDVQILDRWFGQFRRRILSPSLSKKHTAEHLKAARGAEDEEEADDQ